MNTINTSIVVLLSGIFVVFMVLILLVLIVKCMGNILVKYSDNRQIENKERNFLDKQINVKPKNSENNITIDNSTIAAISAAVSYNYLNSNKKYKICSIKRNFYADNRSVF